MEQVSEPLEKGEKIQMTGKDNFTIFQVHAKIINYCCLKL